MANIVGRADVGLKVTLELNESELRALDALVGYGTDAFLAAFYQKLGRSYMEPHESGLRELFASVRGIVPGLLQRADAARKAFEEGVAAMQCVRCAGTSFRAFTVMGVEIAQCLTCSYCVRKEPV